MDKIKNMSSKKPLITIIIIIVVLAVGWYLWRGGYFGKSLGTSIKGTTTTQPEAKTGGMGGGEADTSATAKTGTVGKMTDDIYVEMIVQAAYWAQKDPMAYVTNIENLYKKYGITEENVTAYGKELEKDPARAQAIAAKYSQELKKLMK